MRRRGFIALVGGTTTFGGPLAARAQPAGKKPTIGFMGPTNEAAGRTNFNAFVHRLGELGWVDNRNITIVLHWAEGNVDRAAGIAAEFVRVKVDMIVTGSDPFVLAAMRAASGIPIVSVASGDPVGTGQVASLARPGGNVTGMALMEPETAGKRVELLRELVPTLRRLAFLGGLTNPFVVLDLEAVQAAARSYAIEVVQLDIRGVEGIAPLIEQLIGSTQALYVSAEPFVTRNAVHINALVLAAQLPAMHGLRENAAGGGLISYGAELIDLYRRGAVFVDKILRGAKPADLPVEQPTKFDLLINLKTARALGLTIPPSLLARADEVIE